MTTATALDAQALETPVLRDKIQLEDLYARARDRVNQIHDLMEATRKARAAAGSLTKLHERLQKARTIRNQAGAALQAFEEVSA